MTMIKVLTLCGCFALTLGYPFGAPLDVCETMTPGHGYIPQSSPPPYNIIVSNSEYMPGQTILVTINATRPNIDNFKGFFISARLANCSSPDVPVGRFINVDEDNQIQMKTCPNGKYKDNAVTHTWSDKKIRKSFLWYNPSGGEVYFKFTVVKQKDTYWTNIKTAVLRDASKAWGAASCAQPGYIDVEYVDPARLSTKPPTTMYPWYPDFGNETVVAWPSSGAGETAVSFSFSVMFALAANLFL